MAIATNTAIINQQIISFYKDERVINSIPNKCFVYSTLKFKEEEIFSYKEISTSILFDERDKKQLKLLTKFEKEKKRYVDFPIFQSQEVYDKIQQVITSLLEVPSFRIGLELTPKESVLFTILDENFEVHLNLYFQVEDEDDIETFFLLYKNDECIATGYNSTEKTLQIIKENLIQLKSKDI